MIGAKPENCCIFDEIGELATGGKICSRDISALPPPKLVEEIICGAGCHLF
jgi:hypothetical protein